MARDGVAVIEVAKLLRIKGNFAAAVEVDAQVFRFDLVDCSKFTVDYSLLGKGGTKLNAITFCKETLCCVVNTDA